MNALIGAFYTLLALLLLLLLLSSSLLLLVIIVITCVIVIIMVIIIVIIIINSSSSSIIIIIIINTCFDKGVKCAQHTPWNIYKIYYGLFLTKQYQFKKLTKENSIKHHRTSCNPYEQYLIILFACTYINSCIIQSLQTMIPTYRKHVDEWYIYIYIYIYILPYWRRGFRLKN